MSVSSESQGPEDGSQHSTRNVFKFHKHGKPLAPSQSTEVAPLLANGNVEDPESDGDLEHANGKQSKVQKLRAIPSRTLYWIQKNIKLLVIVLLLIAGVIAFCIYLGMTYSAKPTPKPASVCLTPACVLAASEILQSLSPRHHEIDPCTDFDQFVCEGWQEKHDLRADQGSSFTGTIMAENSQRLLRHVLESRSPDRELNADDHEIFKKMQSAYDACMGEDKLKKLGSTPLLKVLREIEELFPAKRPNHVPDSFPILVASQQKGLHFDGGNQLSKTISYLTSIGVNSIITLNIAADDKDPDSVVIYLTAPRRPGLPDKAYYKDEKIVASYSRTIGQVLEALLREASPTATSIFPGGYNEPSKTSEDLVKAIVDLESKLAEVTPDTEHAEDVTKYYNPRTLEETRALFPQISIQHIISSLAPQYDPRHIIVGSPSYLSEASNILHDTTAETLQAYFVWKTVQAYADKVEDDALKPLKRFENQLQGKDPDAAAERWRTCVRHVDNGLGWILSRFFIEKAFSREAKEFGNHIVSDIKNQFIKTLEITKWMTEDVRRLGVEKVHNIVQKIGYPTASPNIEDPSVLKDYYATLAISKGSYFDNALTIAKFGTTREWSALGTPTNRDEWDMSAPTVNAYYNPAGNEIVFPAGIMQSPVFYNPAVPQYLSYAAFGSISGHELSHAFDSSGRHYNQYGNFTDWWNNQTVQAFKEKARCFIDQYHEFTVAGPNGKPLHVNGGLTLGENIADAGGLNAAFAAWRERENDEPGQLLPGLQDFTKEQMFFISYGNWWCGKVRPEAAIRSIYTDPHAPTWARIKGTMDNSHYFKTAFNCPKKAATCELW